MQRDLFSGVSFDPARFRSDMQRTGARMTYAIFFTPRSGSSWLTEVVRGTRCLGRPEEWFNPSFVPGVAQSMNANKLADYVKMLKRKQAPGGLFGFEITYYQMRATFGGEGPFLALFPPETPAFHLVRENIVLQAVSLAKSVATSVYHSAGSAEADIRRADEEFRYEAPLIRHWLEHILDQETRFERFFERNGLAPVRLSYERMMAAGRDGTLAVIAARLGIALEPGAGRRTGTGAGHRKIGTDKNRAFAERFAAEEAGFLETVAARRAETLAALADARAAEAFLP